MDTLDEVASARTLFRTESITLGRSECGPTGNSPSPEELTPDFTVVFPQSGMYVRLVEGEEIVASPAVALFVDAGQVSRTRHPAGGGDHSVYMVMSPELAAWFGGPAGTPRATTPVSSGTSLAVRVTARQAEDGEALSALHLEELVAAVSVDWAGRSNETGRALAAVRRAEEYLAVHFREDLGLRAIADEVGYSPHHLSRSFRRVVGVPLSVYRSRLRVGAAMTRLLDGEGDIARVAVESGFYDHSHLVRHLRRQLGRTPRQIRGLRGGIDRREQPWSGTGC